MVIIDTGAVSRGSGSQGRDREKEIRKKFVERDLIAEDRRDKILLINASKEFVKRTPKNYPERFHRQNNQSLREF